MQNLHSFLYIIKIIPRCIASSLHCVSGVPVMIVAVSAGIRHDGYGRDDL